jgi:F1F0 ATPase subunit 2
MADVGTWVLAWAGAPPAPALALAIVLAGGVLGGVFFGGLWWTVQRLATSPRPVRWLLGSLALRTAIVVPGVYFVSAGRPVPLGLCLLGFVLARAIVLRATRPRRAAVAPLAPRGSP